MCQMYCGYQLCWTRKTIIVSRHIQTAYVWQRLYMIRKHYHMILILASMFTSLVCTSIILKVQVTPLTFILVGKACCV